MLKRINDALENALASEPGQRDKVVIRRLARQLELYLESANIVTVPPEELERSKTLARNADSFLRGITNRRFAHTGFRFGIGQKSRLEPSSEDRLLAVLKVSEDHAKNSTRNHSDPKLENIPKILHCTWAGGGAIARVKSLDGLKSWLKFTDYRIFVWWDSEQLFNMHVRTLLKSDKGVRRLYDDSAFRDQLGIRGSARPGSNQHHHRFLTQSMSKLGTFETTKELWDEVEHDLEPLRQLEEDYPDRFLLCDVRAKGLQGRVRWTNLLHYEHELTDRGMFAAAASDILRYEVIYHFGGVYMDVDIELTGELGQLQAYSDALLAGITPDRNGQPATTPWAGRERIATTTAYNQRCLYISNCIVASCPQSKTMDAVRETIRLAYGCVATPVSRLSLLSDPKKVLSRFWKADTTRSTLDLTGPNVVREVLYQRSRGVPWEDVPRRSVARLVAALSQQPNLATMPKDIGTPFCRIDYVWRDDHSEHEAFWTFISECAVFPMTRVLCDTEAATRSDCRTASNQVRGASLKEIPLKKFNPYLPGIAKGQRLKAPWKTFHEQNKKLSNLPLPPVEKVGQRLLWAHARWEVTSIETTAKKGKELQKDEWRVELEKLD